MASSVPPSSPAVTLLDEGPTQNGANPASGPHGTNISPTTVDNVLPSTEAANTLQVCSLTSGGGNASSRSRSGQSKIEYRAGAAAENDDSNKLTDRNTRRDLALVLAGFFLFGVEGIAAVLKHTKGWLVVSFVFDGVLLLLLTSIFAVRLYVNREYVSPSSLSHSLTCL